MEKICECDNINWDKYFEDDSIYDKNKCKCCDSKRNRGELTENEYKNICKWYKLYYSKGRKHIFPPCNW